MTISPKELKQIAALAYLDVPAGQSLQLVEELNSIMDFVEQLSAVDTQHVAPLFHPYALHQRLREDVATEESCLAELKAIAPLFEDDLYWVPKVIEADPS